MASTHDLYNALQDLVSMLRAGEAGRLGVTVLRFNGGSVTEDQYQVTMRGAEAALEAFKENPDA